MTLRNSHGGVSTKSYTQSNSLGQIGNYVLKPDALAQLWQPSWEGTNTTIRILPTRDPENPGKFLPTRIDDPSGMSEYPIFSSWIVRYWAIRRFGEPKITMLVADDAIDQNELNNQCPASVLRRAVLKACERRTERPGWSSLVNGQQAILTPPKMTCLVQAFLFRWKNKPYYMFNGRHQPPRGARPDDTVVVMMLPPSASGPLMKRMDEGKEPYEKDPVALHPGGFVHIFERGKPPHLYNSKANAGPPQNLYESHGGGGGDQSDNQFRGYDIDITPTLDGGPHDPPASLQGNEKLVASKVRSWDELLLVRSWDEQLNVLCRTFLSCPDKSLKDVLVDVLKYTFSESHDLPEEILNYGRRAVALNTPAPSAAPPLAKTVQEPPENPFGDPDTPPATTLYNMPVQDTNEDAPADAVPANPQDLVPSDTSSPFVAPNLAGALPSKAAAQKAIDAAQERARLLQAAKPQPVAAGT